MAKSDKRWDSNELHVWLEDRLRGEDRDDLANVLKECRMPFLITCLCCGDRMEVSKGCAKRWCPVCGPKVAAKRYHRIAPIARRMQWPLSVMLTVRNPAGIKGSVAMLADKFRQFRRTKFWQKCVKGGFVGYELTHNGNGAHVHLHALVDCEWLAVATPRPARGHTHTEIARLCQLAQAELSAVWAAYLEQPQAVVWVRRADRNALAETIKYPFKPSDFKKLKCSLSEIIDEIDAGRRVATFGNCHGTSKDFLGKDLLEPHSATCKVCGASSSLIPRAVVDQWARGCGRPSKKHEAAMDLEYYPETGLVTAGKWFRNEHGIMCEVADEDMIPW